MELRQLAKWVGAVAGLGLSFLVAAGAYGQSTGATTQYLFRIGAMGGGAGGMIVVGPSVVPGHIQSTLRDVWQAEGATGAVSWQLTPVPGGLNFNPLDNGFTEAALTGIPTAQGEFSAILTATDSVGHVVSRPITIDITGILSIGEIADYCALQGAPVDIPAPTVLGSPATPESWAVEAGALPRGLVINSATGEITGNIEGTSSLRLQVTDASGATAISNSFTLCTGSNQLTVSSIPSIFGHIGTRLAGVEPTVTGNGVTLSAPLTFGMETGSLPSGLSLDSSTGIISGTPSEAGVTDGVSLWAQDGAGHTGFEQSQFEITIYPALEIPFAANQTARVDTAANLAPPTVENSPVLPATWTSVGQLPEGLSVDPATGYITGTPQVAGTVTAQLKITDAQGASATSPTFTITVLPELLISNAANLTTRQDIAKTGAAPTLSGSPVGAVTWSIVPSTNSAPPCDPAAQICWAPSISPRTGAVTIPTPNSVGSQTIAIKATDETGYSAPAVNVTTTVLPALSVDFASPSAAMLAESPTLAETHVGLAGPPAIVVVPIGSPQGATSMSLTGGTLPPGMTFDPSSGRISGVPTQVGNFRFAIGVTDTAGWTGSGSLEIDVLPMPSAPATTVALRTAYPTSVGFPAQPANCIEPKGGVCSWNITSGSLPPGLSLSYPNNVATISGAPTTVGTYTLTFGGADGVGAAYQTSMVFNVTADFLVVVSPKNFNTATLGQSLSAQASIQGIDPPPLTWSLTGNPSWLAINSQTGAISGTATAVGSWSVTVTATDSTGIARTASLPVTVQPVSSQSCTGSPLSIAVSSSINVGEGDALLPITATLTGAQSGSTPAWAAPGLPSWMTLTPSADGLSAILAGTAPQDAQSDPFSLEASQGSSCASASLTVNVQGPVSPPTGTTIEGRVGETFSMSAASLFGESGASWAVKSGPLPSGLSLSSAGLISGTLSDSAASATVVLSAIENGNETDYSVPIVVYPMLDLAAVTDPSMFYPDSAQPFVLSPPKIDGEMPGRALAFGLTGTLQNGLSLDTTGAICGAVGDICGTPTAVTPESLVYTLTEAPATIGPVALGGETVSSNQFTLEIADSFTLSTPPSVIAQLGGSFTSGAPQIATGTPDGSLSFALAPGYSIADPNVSVDSGSGKVEGSPSIAGSYEVAVQGTDQAGGKATTSAFDIDVWPALTLGSVADVNTRVGGVVQTPAPAVGNLPTGYDAEFSSTVLPAGLSLDPKTGVISGSPTAAGTTAVTLYLIDALIDPSKPLQTSFTINVAGPLTATAPTFGADGQGGTWHVGQTNVSTPAPSVAGNPLNPTWSLATGALPEGMSIIASSGVITGSPTVAGSYDVALQVMDAYGSVAQTQQFTLTVLPPLSIATVGNQVMRYSVQGQTAGPAVSGDPVDPVTWQLLDGSGDPVASFPAGLGFDNTLGVIEGMPSSFSTAPVTETFEVAVTDALGATAVSNAFTLTINPGFSLTLGASRYTLHAGQVGSIPAPTIAGEAVTPILWTLASGSLPAGLSLNDDGSISGSPMSVGNALNLTVNAVDSGQTSDGGQAQATSSAFAIDVVGPLSISSVANLDLHINQSISQTVTANNVVGTATYSLASGSLPNGVTLDPTTGELNGAPTEVGAWDPVIQVTDATGESAQSNEFTITVSPPLGVDSVSNATGRVGVAMDIAGPGTLNAFTPVSYAISPALPQGLSMDSLTGEISGIPTSTVDAQETITVVDQSGQTASTTFELDVLPALTLSPPASVSYHEGQTIALQAPTVGNNPVSPVAFALGAGSAALPPALSVDGSTGVVGGALSGTVDQPTLFTANLQVTDATGASAVSPNFTIDVYPPMQVAESNATPIMRVGLGSVVVAAPTTQFAIGGVTWSLASDSTSLPQGVTLNGDGSITGAPTQAGVGTLDLEGTDSVGGIGKSGQFSLTVLPPLTMAQEVNTNGFGFEPYDLPAPAIGNSPQGAVTWSIAAGALPPGLQLNFDGSISGTPTVNSGVYPGIELEAIDSQGASVIGPAFSITISTPQLFAANLYPVTAEGASPYVAASYDGVTGFSLSAVGNYEELDFSQPVTSDGTDAVLSNSDGAQLQYQYYDTASQQWLPVTRAVTSTQFRLMQTVAGFINVPSFRIGYEGNYPAHTVSISAATVQPAVNVAYSQPLSGVMNPANTSGAANWSILSGTPPTGFSIAVDGTLSGTAANTNAGTVEVQVVDAAGVPSVPQALTISPANVASQNYPSSMAVGCSNCSSAPVPVVDMYDNSAATNTDLVPGGGFVEFDFAQPVLVNAIDFISAEWQGSPPTLTALQYWNGTAFVANTGGGAVESTKFRIYNISATANLTISRLRLGYGSAYPGYLPSLAQGASAVFPPNVAQSTTLDALFSTQNVSGPETWTLLSGTVPAGISISPSGQVTGTPTSAVSTALTYEVTDSRGIASAPETLVIASDLPIAYIGVSTGGTPPAGTTAGNVLIASLTSYTGAAPSVPAGWTGIYSTEQTFAGYALGYTVAYRFASGTSADNLTSANAAGIEETAYSGVAAVGAAAGAASTSSDYATWEIPGLTLKTPGNSWVVLMTDFAGGAGGAPAIPAGMTNWFQSSGGTFPDATYLDTANSGKTVSSYAGQNIARTISTFWAAAVIELEQ